jgi:hypothetical protein
MTEYCAVLIGARIVVALSLTLGFRRFGVAKSGFISFVVSYTVTSDYDSLPETQELKVAVG